MASKPALHHYEPITVSAEMGKGGYWIVTISMAPAAQMSIMVAKMGVTQQEAIDLVLQASSRYPVPRGYA